MEEMEREFSAVVTQDGDWYVAQCLELDVASQGRDEEQALANLQEALELHFLEPIATTLPPVKKLRVKVRGEGDVRAAVDAMKRLRKCSTLGGMSLRELIDGGHGY